MPGQTTTRVWCDDREEVNALLRYLIRGGEVASLDAAMDVLDEPWHFEAEYRRMLADREQVA
ncbi:MAG TPA: hypothetical protein VFJ21_13915 [Mycobacteriales bacterium]|nr:hypothetical protein [Mycobacteriales bacterium]